MTPKDLILRKGYLVDSRLPLEGNWHDVIKFVRPYGERPSTTTAQGDPRVNEIYDGTAPDALEQLASGLQSFLVNPVDRWFEFGFNTVVFDLDSAVRDEALDWFEYAADAVYSVYSNDASGFNQTVNEVFLDSGAFGTGGCIQEWSDELGMPFFKALPLSSFWVCENYRGLVDEVMISCGTKTKAQLIEEFGEDVLPDDLKRQDLKRNPMEGYELYQFVIPNKAGIPGNVSGGKPWRSFYLLPKFQHILRISGYDTFPFHCSRWVKLASEAYGRSPATKCLPDIRLLNQMERCFIQATEKIISPPIMVDDDSVQLPLRTAPNSIMVVQPGSNRPEPFMSGANIPLTLEILNQKRDFIRQCFYADWLRMEKAKIEMTATEVMDRREEKLRLIAPILGRQQSEFLGPIVKRTLGLLISKGRVEKPPQAIADLGLRVEYVSAAARAQNGVKAVGMMRYVQEIMPVAQVDASVLDRIDLGEVANVMAEFRGVPRRVIRSKSEADAIQAQKQEAAAAQQMAETLNQATSGVKNIAQAQQLMTPA